MKKRGYYSPEVRERAVRLVFTQEAEHASQWAAISSIAEKVGCTAETLRKWVRRSERDSGRRPGLTTDERGRLKDLERENRELKRANEILRKASAYFAQAELDRRPRCGDVHRRAPVRVRSRADLPGAADRSVDLLHAQGMGGGSEPPIRARAAGRASTR